MRFKIYNQTLKRHLTDEEIAIWVDAIAEDRVEKLPERIASHVEECMICKEKIIEISQSIVLSRSSETEEADKIFSQRFKPVPVIQLNTLLKVAAAAVILIGIGTLMTYFIFPKKQDPAMLFAQNFTPYPDVITEKSANWPIDSAHQWLATGLGYYRVKKFDSAFIVFSHLYQKNINNDTISFYFANTVLATDKNPKVAVEIFTSLTGKENPFKESSQWYLSLALLKNSDQKGAKKYLTSLINTSEYYRQKGESLLKELK